MKTRRTFQLVPVLAGICLAVSAFGAAAAPLIQRTGPISIVEVQLPDQQAVDTLTRNGFDVSGVRDNVATVYATDEELAKLKSLGFDFTPSEKSMEKAPTGYLTYATLTAALQTCAADYPDICRLESIGQSVDGRELWALLISDNPDAEEDEPECKYLSTIHGDEPVGTDLTLRFVQWMLQNYATDTRITDFVNETALWVLPMINPDGYEKNSRNNSQGYNLNRRFPSFGHDFTGTWFSGDIPDTKGRPHEVALLINWMLSNTFTLSANFHTGDVVVNYPYDDDGLFRGMDAPTPDDDLFRYISREYSRQNPLMWNSGYFEDGITNGSAWYVIPGGMQDWNYRYLGCNEVTIELYNPKAPAASQLNQIWDQNRESMLAYLETVHQGIRGIVSDKNSGLPLTAEILVDGNEHAVYTDPDVGDYHRMLLPGAYSIEINAPARISRRCSNVKVETGAATRVDAALSNGDINGDGKLDARDVQYVINAILQMEVPYDCDVDGGEVTATDLQSVINAVLSS